MELLNIIQIWFENVLIEKPNFFESIRKYHNTQAMLNSFFPKPLIYWTIDPCHFSISLPNIILIRTLVFVPTRPLKLSVTMLLVILIFAIISVWNLAWLYFLTPFTFTFFFAILKSTLKWISICPFILSIAIWITITILAYKLISTWKKISSISMS